MTARLCAGVCTGLAALGLFGFVFASLLGLTPVSLALAGVATASPLALLKDGALRRSVNADLLSAARAVRHAALRPSWSATAYFIFYLLITLLLWAVFSNAYFELPDGIYTSVQNNYGDLPFHLSVITSFARGANFPPQDPTFAGAHFTYPFIADFVAAMFVRAGASLRDAMFVENMLLALSFVGLLHRWTFELVRDRLAAALASVLVLFSGGLGWIRFIRELRANRTGLFDFMARLSQQYTIGGPTWRWGNALTTLLVPQRSILFGLPLALIVFTIFWRMTRTDIDALTPESEDAGAIGSGTTAQEKRRTKKGKQGSKTSKAGSAKLRVAATSHHIVAVGARQRMIAAGVIAGLLPLVHAHTFVVVLMVGGLLAVLGTDWRAWAAGMGALALLTAGLAYLAPSGSAQTLPLFVKAYVACALLLLGVGALIRLHGGARWREWLAFFVVALIIAAPQLWWATRGSSVEAKSFIGWHVGWDHGDENVWLFWLKNTGLFIPLLLAALVWRRPQPLIRARLLFYYLPFVLCFIIPNLVLLAPWVWDNIKVLFYWYVASVPLVALLLARLWRSGNVWLRGAAVACLLGLTLAGALDVWSVVGSETAKVREFDSAGVRFAELLEQQTQPRSLVLHAPTFNHPVFLSGRQSLMGYPGHIWTHGLKYQDREALIKHIYAGGPEAASLLAGAGVDYVVVGPLERQMMQVNETFFARYPVALDTGDYRLYKVR